MPFVSVAGHDAKQSSSAATAFHKDRVFSPISSKSTVTGFVLAALAAAMRKISL